MVERKTISEQLPVAGRRLPVARYLQLSLLASLFSLLLAGCFGSEKVERPPTPLPPDEVPTEPVEVRPIAELNTSSDDFGASMSLDTTLLLYTTAGVGGEQQVVQSRLSAGVWGTPASIEAFPSDRSHGTPSITPGGEMVYVAGDEYGFGDCDLYAAEVGPRGAVPAGQIPWNVPRNLGRLVNGKNWESTPSISADGSTLYFSSDRPGGYGGRDIWLCTRRRDGTWEEPINAGEAVNSKFDETTPMMSPDGRTLFFASNGHPGLGGFDIFAVSIQGGRPSRDHFGSPINSTGDDIAMSISSDGSHAFLSSNRSGGEGGYDLYTVWPVPVEIAPVRIVTVPVRNTAGAPITAMVEVRDGASGAMVSRVKVGAEAGQAQFVLPRAHNYVITAISPDSVFQSTLVSVPRDLERTTRDQLAPLVLPARGLPTRLMITFEPGRAVLRRESTVELDRLVALLLAEKRWSAEITGHPDPETGNAEAPQLALERAHAVQGYLVGNNVPIDRIAIRADATDADGHATLRIVEKGK